MLRIHCSESAAACARYFDRHLSVGDYYFEGQEIEAGTWHGKGAERLGLNGDVKAADFHALIFNQHPNTGNKLSPRVNANRRCGYDFGFSVPKGVSIVYALGGDSAIKEAFKEAVHHTMNKIEAEAKSRYRDKGANHDITTANLVWSTFIHETARPVNGVCDMQLHAHCYVQNLTYREDKNRFMAVQLGDIKRDAPYFEAIYYDRLASNLLALGYGIEQTQSGWDIAGISQELKDKFSRRTVQIEQFVKEKGLNNSAQKATIGAMTRESKKTQTLRVNEQKQEWLARVSKEELKNIKDIKSHYGVNGTPNITAERAMQFAVGHCFARQAVVSHRKLIATAYKIAVGQVSLAEVEAISFEGLISKSVNGQELCTLQKIINDERELKHLIAKGIEAVSPLYEDWSDFDNPLLNDGQRGAVQYILGNQNRHSWINGKAGVGKTTLLKQLKTAVEKLGMRVHAFAPTAQASRSVLRQDGFENANTIAHLLMQKKYDYLKDSIILLDEIGLASVRDVVKVLKIAEAQNCRVVFCGDWQQHEAVSGISVLSLLRQSHIIEPYEVSEILRQKGFYKQVVIDITNGQFDRALDGFNKAGWILEADDKTLYTNIARDYVRSHHLKVPNLVIAPTHAAGAQVTATIRELLKQRNSLGTQEKAYPVLKNYGFTDAEKTLYQAYYKNQVIEFNRSSQGFKRGEQVKVLGVKDGFVYVKTRNHETKALKLTETSHFDVFNPEEIRLSRGDVILITKNTKDANGFALNNGDRYHVEGFSSDGDILLDGDKVIPSSFRHYHYGYASTSFAAQGKSVPVVQILMNDEVRPAINRAQFYVSASRAKLKAQVYTNSLKRLKEFVGRENEKRTASEIFRQDDEPFIGTVNFQPFPETDQPNMNDNMLNKLLDEFELKKPKAGNRCAYDYPKTKTIERS